MDNQLEIMFRCRIEALVTEREGMIAENQTRLAAGLSPTYFQSDFEVVQNQFQQLDYQLRNY